MMRQAQSGSDYGLNGFTVGQLPSPAVRFAGNPLVCGADGGHSIHVRELARRGVHLHGRFERAYNGEITKETTSD